MMIGRVGTSAAIRTTERICSTVPGLNTMWLNPISVSSSISATASSSSGIPAVTTTPSIGAPA
ncbi:Uncharacterised protein [Mycobacteroides abscessus subsp. abscessus]|nr:Uncharacterised protein [Mycobacteroides abscessus subsp. abscessus]SKU23652.1 Uncharacterised protein [Mycobacteroides abscessus subsp. abscessus]